MYPVKQSTALDFVFFAFDANGDGVTGKVDGDFTKRISKNGAAFAAMTVTISERENGWYHAQLSTSHTDTLGVLTVSFSASGIKRVNCQFRVHARVPDDLAFPNTSGRGMDVDASGGVEVGSFQTGAITSGAFASGAIDNAAFNVTETLTANPAAGGISAASFAAGAIDAAAIATGAIDADAIAADAITAAKIANGAIDAATFAAGAIDAAALAADAGTEIAAAVWDRDATNSQTQGTFGQVLGDSGADSDSVWALVNTNLNATVGSRSSHSAADVWAVGTRTVTAATNITSTGVAVPITAGGLVNSDVAAISTDTTAADNAEAFFDGTGYAGTGNTIPNVTTVATATNVTTVNGLAAGVITAAAIATGAIDADALAADAGTEIASAVHTRQMTEAYAADGVAPTLEQMLYMLWSALGEFSIASTTITCKKLDGSTTSMVFTLDSATAPTSRTRSS